MAQKTLPLKGLLSSPSLGVRSQSGEQNRIDKNVWAVESAGFEGEREEGRH